MADELGLDLDRRPPSSTMGVCLLSRFSHVLLFVAQWVIAHQSLPVGFPRRAGCHALLLGIFQTQGLNPCLWRLLNWQAGSLPPVPPGKPRPFQKVTWVSQRDGWILQIDGLEGARQKLYNLTSRVTHRSFCFISSCGMCWLIHCETGLHNSMNSKRQGHCDPSWDLAAQIHFLSLPRISSLGGGDAVDSHLWHHSLQTGIKKRALSIWTFSIAEGLWLAQCWVTCPPVEGVAISLKSWGHLLTLRSWQNLWLVASPDSYKSGERRGIRSIFLGLLGKKNYIFFIIIILPLSIWDKVLYGKNLPLLIGSGHCHWFF